ncbi:MAG TPA: hypothetical protein VGB15_11670 [Longimicrobium sp.]|jgi:hypothetical protein
MDARQARRLTALAWLAAWGCGRLPGDALPVGSRFPLASAPAAAQVVWVVRPEDWITCQSAAGGIRELQRRTGPGLPLTVVYVGPHESWLSEFLRRQRIAAAIVSMDERRFRRVFRREPAPWLYLLDDGVVRGVLPAGGEIRPARRWAALIPSGTGRQGQLPPTAGAAVNPSQGAAR